jgi:lipopolysaccharide/colanic/teichoic acid biosynthesis glycosyltransferase
MSAQLDPRKRAFDICLCLLILPVAAPLMCVIAVAVLLTSGPPVLYRAKRMGVGAQPFVLLKFRSMRVGAGGPAVTRSDDPRITRVGGWLRRTKLDELPSLWNVLRGDLSWVGPRPEDPRYLPFYSPAERAVLEVRPGITGPAAVRFRDEEGLLATMPLAEFEEFYTTVHMHEKLLLDLDYLSRRSLVFDLRLLCRTAALLLSPRPAGAR